VKEDNN